MKAAIYNPYLDTLGGGERYCLGVARAFAKAGYKVDIEWKSEDIIEKLEKRFGLSLDGTKVVENVSRGDGYDACFWVSDGSVPMLRSRNNILHFQIPFTNVAGKTLINKMKFARIRHVVVNSGFTKGFIDREYGVSSKVLYPPVSVTEFKPRRKQNIISYVGRFSNLAQQKRQDVLVSVFKKFSRRNGSWKLVLAGGAEVGSDDMVRKLEKKARGYPIEILTSPSFSEVKELFGVSRMFWSASGYGVDEQKSPEKTEHFGITVVEAMAAKAVPLVVNKGGFKEIVVDGESGYLWNKTSELLGRSLNLSRDFGLMTRISREAHEESMRFSESEFENSFSKLV